MRTIMPALTLAALLAGPPAIAQQQPDERAVIETLLGPAAVTAEMFHPRFLEAVPIGEVRTLLQGVRETIGAPVTIADRGNGHFLVTTASHDLPVQLALAPDGRITTLFLKNPLPLDLTLEAALSGFGTVAAEHAYLITRNGVVVAARAAAEPLAVGSAFKLGILAVLVDQITAGARSWSDVVTLEARQVSLPTGLLQAFPPGSPLTLHTLAALMISRSDNTATDLLLDVVGRDAVAARLGRDGPVLSTREFFVLKADQRLREQYLAAADAADRQAVLALAGRQPLPAAGAIEAPHQPGIEWYVPLETLCGLIEEVGTLPLAGINPGLADPAAWADIAYKGGSEIGVLNFTTRLESAAGDVYCVAATWNADEAIDEATATALYGQVLRVLAREN